MNGYQVIFVIFSVISVNLSAWAAIKATRLSRLKYKIICIMGSAFGFIGFGINWSNPKTIFFEIGIQVPVIQVLYFPATLEVAGKSMFPVLAAIFLLASHKAKARDA